jgi:hypothetical protein
MPSSNLSLVLLSNLHVASKYQNQRSCFHERQPPTPSHELYKITDLSTICVVDITKKPQAEALVLRISATIKLPYC